ncbi:hypothetical protein P8452_38573 [Trifolium repens]|nr:hypothetical protein P8452_38573 [Trifolium repens]
MVYPMCASVQAIETDSYEKTKHLISYWILLSLIYLFEYAFMNLLLWFQLWPYIKLMTVFWLIIPDFGRASYVYNNLMCTMKPQIVTCWRKCFVEKDNFIMHAERYMKENGTEALEKLIASKNTMCRPDAEVSNEIKAAEMLKTNGGRFQTKHKDINDLEAIVKKEIPATKQMTYANIEASQKEHYIAWKLKLESPRALNQGSFEHKVKCDKSMCEDIGNFLVGPGVDSTDISSVSLINRIIFKVLIKSIIPREGSETKMSWVHKYLIKLLNQETPINLSLYQPAYIFHHLCSSVRKFQKSPEVCCFDCHSFYIFYFNKHRLV